MVNIQKEAEGTYICVARNSAGQATQEFDVAVIGRYFKNLLY